MTELHARLIGRSEFRADGRQLPPWPRPSARRLVTLLVTAPEHRRTRDELADALFPHLPPDRAARSISRALSLARSILPPDVLAADAMNVWVADHLEVTTDFDDPTALASGRLPLADDPYEDWAIEIREGIQRRQVTALLERARQSADREDWQRVVDRDPSSEEACLGLAVAAAREGDTDAVVGAFERHRAALIDLGLEPRAAVLLRVQQLTEVAAEAALITDVVLRAPPLSLHGREEVIDHIAHTLVGPDFDDPAPGTQVVVGPAGIGKSSIVHAVAAQLQAHGWRVGHGVAAPDDHLAPLAALRSAMRWLLLERDDPLRGHGDVELGDAAPGDVARLADDVDAALAGLPGPALLVLDDLQWADAALQRLVARLAVRPDRGWALLVAARSDEPGSPVPDLPSGVPHLQLPPLNDDAAAALVRAELSDVDEDRVATIVQRGAGNPFFLLELARSDDDGDESQLGPVPDRVVALLRRRLAPVSTAARRLLEYLAVLGPTATPEDLTHAAVVLGEDGVLLDELASASLVRADATGLSLAHPLLRDAVLAEINLIRRAMLHVRVAEVHERLADHPGRDREDRLLAAARHRVAAFQLGGQTVEDALVTAHRAFDAAQLADRMFATEVAEELGAGGLVAFEAIDGTSRAGLAGNASATLRMLGHIRLSRGELAAGEDAYRQALALAPDALARAKCWRALAWIPYRVGDLDATVEVCEQGLVAVSEDPLASALLRVELGWCLQRSGRVEEALPVLEEAAQVAEESGDWDLAARALDRLGVALDGADHEGEGLATLQRAAAAASRTGKHLVRAGIAVHTASSLSRLGRHPEAVDAIEHAAELADRIGDAYLRSVAHWIAAEVHERAGNVERALAERDAEVKLLRTIDNARHLSTALAHRAVLLAEAGRDDDAAISAAAARDAADRAGPQHRAAIEARLAEATGTDRPVCS